MQRAVAVLVACFLATASPTPAGASAPLAATVDVYAATRMAIASALSPAPVSTTLDRAQWFNAHISPPTTLNVTKMVSLNAHIGRSFMVSYSMGEVKADPARPGYVDKASLLAFCSRVNQSLAGWPAANVDMIVSSKTQGYYPPAPPPPFSGYGLPHPNASPDAYADAMNKRGLNDAAPFVPGSHDAAAEYWSLYLEHCAPPYQQHYFCEVANECNVAVDRYNTTWEEMIDLHIAIADRVHRDLGNASKPFLVGGPTAAYPQWEAGNFSLWADIMGPFITQAGPHMDFISVHLYDTMEVGEEPQNYTVRSGNNDLAILDLHEAYGLKTTGRILPHLLSEYGTGFKNKNLTYSPAHDWLVLRGVKAHLFGFLERPDRILKAIPFIVGDASWHSGPNPYPWVLWRKVDGAYTLTHLIKFYEIWAAVQGERLRTTSTNANVQHAAFRNGSTLYLAVNNLTPEPATATLAVHDATVGATVVIQRLYFNPTSRTPTLTRESGPFPAKGLLDLRPEEMVLLTLEQGAVPSAAPAVVTRRDWHSASLLVPIEKQASHTFSFNVSSASGPLRLVGLRLGLAGPAETLTGLLQPQFQAYGHSYTADAQTDVAGRIHEDPKTGAVWASLQSRFGPSQPCLPAGLASAEVTLNFAPSVRGNISTAVLVTESGCV